MPKRPKTQHTAGFTLMELMIVIAILGILVLIALPSYKNYTRRAHYTEVVQAAAPYKLGIEECFQLTGELNDCQAGRHGVPLAITSGQGAGLVDSINVNQGGAVTLTPREKYGLTTADSYTLTPTIENGVLVWHSSGNAVTQGYAN